MLKIIIIFFLSIHSFENIYSQGEYYSIINEAEKLIVENNQMEAIGYYNKAFIINTSPFIKDVHNALICALKSKNVISSKVFIDILLEFDLDTNFYYKSPKLIDLHDNFELYEYFKNGIINRPIVNRSKCAEFKLLLALDQSIRNACREINSNYYRICGNEIRALDSLILLKLKLHLKENGVPSDRSLCLINSNYYRICGNEIRALDSLILLKLKLHLKENGVPSDRSLCLINSSSTPAYVGIIEHSMQWGKNDLDSILLESINNYKIHPLLYSDLKDYYRESYLKIDPVYGLSYNVKLGDRLFIFPAKDNAEIDKNRASIFLDSIAEYNRKVVFQYKNPEYFLIYPRLLPTLDAGVEMEKELAEQWKEFEVHR